MLWKQREDLAVMKMWRKARQKRQWIPSLASAEHTPLLLGTALLLFQGMSPYPTPILQFSWGSLPESPVPHTLDSGEGT